MGRKKKVRQLDYDTGEYIGEYIGEYESVEEAAYDNFITRESLNRAFLRNNGYMHLLKLRFEKA